ncbi:stage III sporulation protein AF [Bacillus suaedae]|uniref:Stage III sporulation protein AF n=1 Tax=Halalkalibacter suaedae TaxID=2822140 RepID=A0A940X067_9BACI|nr:stage III sporulation protein AF [Bacillus suaedae]MBP3952311.1 stage III sporulation protein AF [Bacillus suaedae]
MGFLTDWLTNIILLILLATILELMLPNSNMQRYVRMVVGLLLLVVMLQPLLSIFTEDVDEWLFSLSHESEYTEKKVQDAINLQKRDIEMGQRAYISEQMAVQLEKQVEETLRETHDLELSQVVLEFEADQGLETMDEAIAAIKAIHVNVYTVAEDEGEEQSASGVKPVEVVRIDTTESGITEEPVDTNKEFERVQQFLSDHWNVPAEKILLAWEGGKQAK